MVENFVKGASIPGNSAPAIDFNRCIFILTGLVIAYLVLPPLFFIVHTSLVRGRGIGAETYTLSNFAVLLGSIPEMKTLLWNSFLFSVGSAGGAVLGGTLLAWLAERTNAGFRGVAYVSAFVSFAIPGIVKVIGWIILLGPKAGILNVAVTQLGMSTILFDVFTLPGMILIESFIWTPVVFLLMSTPFRSMDPSLEEAAALSGGSAWKVFKKVTLPLALPSMLAVLMLTFVRSLESFEIPALIGIPAGIDVLTTKIYQQIKGGIFPKYGQASAYSLLLMAFVGLSLIPYYRITKHTESFTTITGKGFRPRRIDLGSWRWLGGSLLLVLPLLQLLPVFAILWSSLLPYGQQPSWNALKIVSWKNYAVAFSDSTVLTSIGNSLMVSTLAATGTVVITFFAAWLVVRTTIRRRWLLDQLSMIPLVFPGIVMGVAMLKMYLTVPLPIYGTIWILVLAFIARYLPYGMRFNHAGLLGIHRELEESAAVSGASWWQVVRRILIPLMLPPLFGVWIYIFLITIKELSLALLLYSSGSQIISVTIWELWENGHVGELAAFSLVITVGTVLLAIFFQRLAQRYGLKT